MLEEMIATFLSLFSALTMDAPRISREMSNNVTTSDKGTPYTWDVNIHREYASFEQEKFPSITEYVQLGSEPQDERTYRQSLFRSLKMTLTITLALVPLMLIGMVLVYFDLRTNDLCFQSLTEKYTLSFDVMRIRLLGNGIETVIINLWFPVSIMILFGWSEFKSHYSSTMWVGLLTGLLSTLYFSFLLLYGVYDKSLWYRTPGYVLYVVAVLWECIIVVRKVRQNHPGVSYSNLHIFVVISLQCLLCIALGTFYHYTIVKLFNSLDNVLYKFIVAFSTPTIALVPAAVCRHLALRRVSEIIDPGKSFLLFYFIRAGYIALYRIMQADFQNIWLFIGLSVLSGVSNVLKTATVGVRVKVWSRVIKVWNKICCIRLQHLTEDTPHHRRLKADTEIQNILFENYSVSISQAYIVLYSITTFELSAWTVVKSSLIRVAIGLGIEFVFNFFSTFIRIHWHDIPIARVWSKYWKRHVLANGIIVVVLVFYFTQPLLGIFQHRFHKNTGSGTAEYSLRNCTLFYESWR
jgi:hypothetical protein